MISSKGDRSYSSILIDRFFPKQKKNLKKTGQFFQVAMHFHPGHSQPNTVDNGMESMEHGTNIVAPILKWSDRNSKKIY